MEAHIERGADLRRALKAMGLKENKPRRLFADVILNGLFAIGVAAWIWGGIALALALGAK